MNQRLCDLCEVRPADMKYREVTGWEELRQGGGANKIVARTETGRMACWECIWRKKRHISSEQGTFA